MSFKSISFDSPSLHWLHPPPTSASQAPPVSNDNGHSATILTGEGTDWWHTPERDSQDGLAWGQWVALGEEGFEVRVKASIKEKNRVGRLDLVVPVAVVHPSRLHDVHCS